jgi:hypothetical protein
MSRLNVVALLAAFVTGVGATAALVLLLVKHPPPAELLGFLGNLLGAVMASAITVAGGYFLFRHQQRHTAQVKLTVVVSALDHIRRLLLTLTKFPEGDTAEHRRWLNGVPETQSAIAALANSLGPDADFPYEVNVAIGLLEISINRLLSVEAVTYPFGDLPGMSHSPTVQSAAIDALSKLDGLERALPSASKRQLISS